MDKKPDPNVIAYIRDLKSKKHKDLQPGTWVAYHNGIFVLSEKDKDIFFKKLRKANESFFVAQIGFYPEPIDLSNVLGSAKIRSPRIVKKTTTKKPKRV